MTKHCMSCIISTTCGGKEFYTQSAATRIRSSTLSLTGHLLYTIYRVCKKFHAIFEESTLVFFPTLCIPSTLERQRLPDMYKWILKYGGAAQSLVASIGTPWLEAALGVLAAHHSSAGSVPHLAEIILSDVPAAAMTLLGQFSSITTMTLESNDHMTLHSLHPELDLSYLEDLPHLVKLTLQNGRFHEVDAAQCLTHLVLKQCRATCSGLGGFVASLKELYIWESGLVQVHTNGIAACSNLEALHMIDGYISGVSPQASMRFCDHQEYQVTESLSNLTALTYLYIFYVHPSEDVQFAWLADLKSLQTLDIGVKVHTLELPASISALSQLRMLDVVNSAADGQSLMLFDWTAFDFLQKLTLRGPIQCGQGLAQLASLNALTHIVLSGMHNSDADTTAQVGRLGYKLGVTRLDVVFILE